MIVLSNLAAHLALNEDTVTKYACLAESEAQLGLALSAMENISTLRPLFPRACFMGTGLKQFCSNLSLKKAIILAVGFTGDYKVMTECLKLVAWSHKMIT